MSLRGKNVIITGATSGFGAQIASVLSGEEGAAVFIGGRRIDRGTQVAKETNSTFHVVDVADEESSKTFFAAAEAHFGGRNVDFILLNAGLGGTAAETVVPNLNVQSYDLCFGVNVRGIFLGLQYGAPLLRTGGTFLFTSSIISILPASFNPAYGASKAAVDSLVRSYAAQFAESPDERIQSLSVMGINPTLYETEMSCRYLKSDANAFAAAAKVYNPSQRVGKAEGTNESLFSQGNNSCPSISSVRICCLLSLPCTVSLWSYFLVTELAVIVRDLVSGKLPYKSGDTIACDADTHFPLDEYASRLKAGQEAANLRKGNT
jgi:NAD(P)-dependent dehydrogenase (short-subunit alcohol dehydrogenase family)